MTDAPPPPVADEAAAAWFAKLQNPVISQADLRALRSWRKDPENDAAFRRQQDLWRAAAKLHGDIDIERAVQQALDGRAPWRAAWAPAGGLAVAALCAVFLLWTHRGEQTFATRIGEQRVLALSDGSIVRLDADSRLRVRLGRTRRDLVLESGRAMFEVAHDPRHPFVVTAGRTVVTALGTRFDVRRFSKDQARVVLLQGQVEVIARDARAMRSWRLTPGQQLADTSRAARPQIADVEAETGWASGRLVFRNTPILEALAEANRYSLRPLVLADGVGLGDAHLDGVFRAGDAQALSAALAALYDLRVEDDGRGPIVLKRIGAAARSAPPAA